MRAYFISQDGCNLRIEATMKCGGKESYYFPAPGASPALEPGYYRTIYSR